MGYAGLKGRVSVGLSLDLLECVNVARESVFGDVYADARQFAECFDRLELSVEVSDRGGY